MSGAVAKNVQASGRINSDCLDRHSLFKFSEQVARSAVNHEGNDLTTLLIPSSTRGSTFHGLLLLVDDEVDAGHECLLDQTMNIPLTVYSPSHLITAPDPLSEPTNGQISTHVCTTDGDERGD